MSVSVIRPVHVKVIVTEQFKTRRSAQIKTALSKLEAMGKRLDYQLDRLPAQTEQGGAVLERLRAEKRRNEQARTALVRELDKVCSLENGTEYRHGVLQGTVEVEVGDDFSKLGLCEIVVKDDKVVEIRDGLLCPNECEI